MMLSEREKQNVRSPAKVSPSGELIVQHLSSTVSGDAQKYCRIGLSEFVPFEYDDLSIKAACQQHFPSLRESDLECDVSGIFMNLGLAPNFYIQKVSNIILNLRREDMLVP